MKKFLLTLAILFPASLASAQETLSEEKSAALSAPYESVKCDTATKRNTTCKDGALYCGDRKVNAAQQGTEWGCINGKWVCLNNACACGKQSVGKFGECLNGTAWCGDAKAEVPWTSSDAIEWICQKNKYVCANPAGCSHGNLGCAQFQSFENGKCAGKKAAKDAKIEPCLTGNCPCGKGKCMKNGLCVDGECICGSPDEGSDIHNAFVSNDYGEFTCIVSRDVPDCGPNSDTYALICEKKAGCKRADGKLFAKTEFNNNEIEVYHIKSESEIEVTGDEKALKRVIAKLENDELIKYGRASAEDFPRNIKDFPINNDATSPYELRAEIRTKCDTMPVPRNRRSDYKCNLRKRRAMQCDEEMHSFEVYGLKCANKSGCPCFEDTCAKGEYCYGGICTNIDDTP